MDLKKFARVKTLEYQRGALFGRSRKVEAGEMDVNKGFFNFDKEKSKEAIDAIHKEYRKTKTPTEDHDLKTLGALEFGRRNRLLGAQQVKTHARLHEKYHKHLKLENRTHPFDEGGPVGISVGLGSMAAMLALPSLAELTDNPDTKQLISTMAKERGVELNEIMMHEHGLSGMMNSYFDPSNKIISTVPSEAVALHELGHATDWKTRPRLKTILRFSASNIPFLGSVIASLPIPAAYKQVPLLPLAVVSPLLHPGVRKRIAGEDKKSLRHKVIKKIEKHPWMLGAAATSPILWSEGKASAYALRDLAKLRGIGGVAKGVAAFLPAFGTYAGLSALAGLASHRLLKYQKGKEKLEQKNA